MKVTDIRQDHSLDYWVFRKLEHLNDTLTDWARPNFKETPSCIVQTADTVQSTDDIKFIICSHLGPWGKTISRIDSNLWRSEDLNERDVMWNSIMHLITGNTSSPIMFFDGNNEHISNALQTRGWVIHTLPVKRAITYPEPKTNEGVSYITTVPPDVAESQLLDSLPAV